MASLESPEEAGGKAVGWAWPREPQAAGMTTLGSRGCEKKLQKDSLLGGYSVAATRGLKRQQRELG